jgi:uncharacterized protein YjbI with pentapeptide repeats
LAPFVVLIIHAYALMHFIMLGKKASRFHNELRRQFPAEGNNKEIRDKLRRLLPSNIFVQILAGPPELRTGIFGAMLKLIALTTLVAFPVLVLLLLQIQFLPFHDVTITWAQRAALSLDIVLLWLLRPPILADLDIESSGRARVFSRPLRGFGFAFAAVTSVLAVWLSIVVATIPGEWQETALASLNQTIERDLLFAGAVDGTTRRRRSPVSNTLVLSAFNLFEALKIDDPKRLEWKEHFFDLRARHLEKAVLNGADLTRADLTGAWLQGASLEDANLRGASLDGAQLQGTSLGWAQLQGASLEYADLHGASLQNAKLQGASLMSAQLQGASLEWAQLQGASLASAKLEGASLRRAQVQGVSLEYANLQGTLLTSAELQGASLDNADVYATDFSGAFLWRTNWGYLAKLENVRLTDVNWKSVWRFSDFKHLPVPWDSKADASLRDSLNMIPDGKVREAALKRVERLDCGNPNKNLASCDPTATLPPEVLDWQKKLSAARVDDATYAKVLATTWRDLVCRSDANAIYILRGAIKSEQLGYTGQEAPALVDFIMSKDCPVSASLTGDDKWHLLKIKQDAEQKFRPPPASKKDK